MKTNWFSSVNFHILKLITKYIILYLLYYYIELFIITTRLQFQSIKKLMDIEQDYSHKGITYKNNGSGQNKNEKKQKNLIVEKKETQMEKIDQKSKHKNKNKIVGNNNLTSNNNNNKQHSKDLMRFQRQIFQIKKPQESEQQYVIRKLMTKKEKPQIGLIDKSPLLQRLQFMMPIFKQSQEELSKKVITQDDKIDAKLEQLPSQSSSSDQQQQQEENKAKQGLKPGMITQVGFEPLYSKKDQSQVMVEQELQSLTTSDVPKELEIVHFFQQKNFLTYPYLKPQQIQKFTKQKMQKGQKQKIQQQQNVQKNIPKGKSKVLIQEIKQLKY